MSTLPATSPPISPQESAHLSQKALRNAFILLFLRGRSARALRRETVPKSIAQKLSLTLLFYALFGMLAFSFVGRPVFQLAVYLHAMTLIFLGMFLVAASGEVLFNKEEADILMHRPITPQSLLWAKIGVLVKISLWIAGAFNLVGLFAGMLAVNGDWRFPFVHAISTVLEALFCAGFVVLAYQLCLRWFGRDKLEGLMTSAQVIVVIGFVLIGQIFPQFVVTRTGSASFSANSWWIAMLPPSWFAGFDDALAGTGSINSIIMAIMAVGITALILWLAFGKLANDYQSGLQAMNESSGSSKPMARQGRRWINTAVDLPPLRWWLRNPVERASFLLTAAYLTRDRDTKLRIYPSIAPFLVMPLIFLMQGRHQDDPNMNHFGIAFLGAYIGVIPAFALSILQYSQQWQASDVFRSAPIPGPAEICNGARRAVMLLIGLPMTLAIFLIIWFLHSNVSEFELLIPGLIALPIYTMLPNIRGGAVPLSTPTEEAKSAQRGIALVIAMFASMGLSGVAMLAWSFGYMSWFLAGEVVMVICLYAAIHLSLKNARWQPIE
jgi:ABC-2 type transport system permease protein